MKYLYITVFAFLFAACNSSEKNVEVKEAEAYISDKTEANISGLVTFTQSNDTVHMRARLSNLSAGKHAIHLHENGDCSASDASSAGGHWNPLNMNHGKIGSAMFHRGDIGNLDVDSSGNVDFEFSTNLWCLNCDDSTKNILNKAVIIHSGADDFTSQPSGAAGKRVACGVIEAK
ncbi:superoxide dismutase family protein [bacterium]|nr:superoxide dismutase family protein [bacterium]